MRETITTCGELVGAALITVAGAMVAPALGLALAGILLTGICWLASR